MIRRPLLPPPGQVATVALYQLDEILVRHRSTVYGEYWGNAAQVNRHFQDLALGWEFVGGSDYYYAVVGAYNSLTRRRPP